MPTTLFLLLTLFLVNFSHQRSVLQNTDCSYFSPTYSISWRFDELSNDIVFNLTARAPFNNSYTAVGFGLDDQPTDVIAVYVRSLQIGLIDGHLAEDGAIESDEKTNVQALQFDYDNGVISAQFARPIETFDSQDADLGSCITMFLPIEPKEIITGAPLELGNSTTKIRVCDIAVTCATKMHNDVVVKRQEDGDVSAICASGPEDQKNRVSWKVEGELVRLSVSQNAKKGRWWTAIGVGESMSDLTIMMMFAETGKLKKYGLYKTEGKMQPQEVELGDVELKREVALVNNGKATFEMMIEKKFFTDRADEQGCFYLQIAILAGQYQPNFNIAKHKDTPHMIQVCNIDACAPPVEPSQEVDEEMIQRQVTSRRLEANLEDVEASGDVRKGSTTKGVEMEGSGVPVVEGLEVTTPKTAEVVDEKPLTGEESTTSSTSTSSTTSSESPTSSTSTTTTTTPSPPPIVTSPTPTTPLPNLPSSSSQPPVFIVDNKTTGKTLPLAEGEVEMTTKNSGCGREHEDLKICDSYFSEYLGKVNEWSERHNLTIGSHMWKACTLLSQVQHVTTMCCTIFRSTCATHLSL